MKVQVDTGGSTETPEKLTAHVITAVEAALGRFADRIVLVDVQLTDRSRDTHRPQADRCAMTARLEGSEPIGVAHAAGTIVDAIDGAANRLEQALESWDADHQRTGSPHRAQDAPQSRSDERWEDEGGSV